MATNELGEAGPAIGMMGQTAAGTDAPLPAPAQRALTFGLLLSACRCILQYVILPFVLPWIGVTGAVPPWLTLLIGGLALLALGRNIRLLWRLRHKQRWSYLALAGLVGVALLAFAVMDVHTLLHR